MKNKKPLIFAAALLSITAAVLFISDDIISPYVSFAEASDNPGKYVQVMGVIDHKAPVVSDMDGFSFSLKEEGGAVMKVFSPEARPLNFDHAEEAVVIGRYDEHQEYFTAEKLLIKCPSKYERKK